jgi:hypothetical protein
MKSVINKIYDQIFTDYVDCQDLCRLKALNRIHF